MTIKVIRLVNGEELIGKYSEAPTHVTLDKVGVVQMIPTQKGVNIGLFPFAPYAEEDSFEFSHDHIVTTFTPATDLLNNYNQMFGSGIQIAGAGSLK